MNKDLFISNLYTGNEQKLDISECINTFVTKYNCPIKYKINDSYNQVVIFYNNYYYKIYIYPEERVYENIIRKNLADIYKSYGIDWEIVTIRLSENEFMDIERRQPLNVLQEWDNNILTDFSKTLSLLEEKLKLEEVAQQIKYEFPDINKLKLIRLAINNPADYAIYDNKVILLDDTEFVLMMINSNNKIMTRVGYPIKININGNNYIFYSHILNQYRCLAQSMIYEPTTKFFIFKYRDSMVSSFHYLKTKLDIMLENNMKLLLDNENSYIKQESNETNAKKSFQWELWTCCNSLCKFCYLSEDNRKNSKERQLKSLKDLDKAIDNLDFNVYNNISLIGGEFFQGQLNDIEVHTAFFKVITKIFNLYNSKKINSIWITCTLTLGDQKHLYELLDLAKLLDIFCDYKPGGNGLWLCTSWDVEGRFHNNNMKSNWEYHMKNIKSKYPWVKLNTTIILMQKFIDMYLDNKFKPKEFMKEYNTNIFYKQPGLPNGPDTRTDLDSFKKAWILAKQNFNKQIGFNFFPTRSSFIKFLNKYYIEDYDTYDKLFNVKYRADELHRNKFEDFFDIKFNRSKNDIEEVGIQIKCLECGHIHYYMPYVDSNKCCICDRNIINEGV